MNLHPALLPSFPGATASATRSTYGVKVTGVTVHFADEEFDGVRSSRRRPSRSTRTTPSRRSRRKIHEVEHRLYPAAIQLFAENRLVIEGRKVRVLPNA